MPQQEIQGVEAPEVRRAFDASNQFAEKGFYQPWIPAGQMTPSGGAVLERVVIAATARDVDGIRLVAAGLPAATTSLRLPPLWVTGQIALEILYTGTVGSVNTINFLVNTPGVNIGSVVPAAATLQALSPAGPGTAGIVMSITTTALATISADSAYAGVKISRFNADAYGAGEVYILGVRPIWYPGRQ